MPMLTIEIANEGVWNAVTCETLGTKYLVLENFRVHPFQDGVVKMRKEVVDPVVMHLQEGTPVVVDGKEGVVIVPDTHMPMIGFDADEVRIVSMDKIAYRMNTTIDNLHEVPSHVMKTFRGVPYLVPTTTPGVVDEDSFSSLVSLCIRYWPQLVLDRAVEVSHMSERDALQSLRSDRARSGFTFVGTDDRVGRGRKIYYACIDPVPENMRKVARPCFRGKFHSCATEAARKAVAYLVKVGNALEEGNAHEDGNVHPKVGDVLTTIVDGITRTHTVVKAPHHSVHPQKSDKTQLVVTVTCPDCDGHIEFNAHQLGDSDNAYRSRRIKDHERHKYHQEKSAASKRTRTPVDSYCEDDERVRVKVYRFSDPDIHPDLTTHLAPYLDKLRIGRMIEEDGQSAYKGVYKCHAGDKYKVHVKNGTKNLYLGTYDSTTVAAVAVCAWRLDSSIESCDAMKAWFHTMKYDGEARRAWVDTYATDTSVHELE